MASSSPPILPISNNLPTSGTVPAAVITTSTTSVQSQAPIQTSAIRTYIANLHESVRNGLSQRRPWSELLDRSAFSKPETVSDATGRIRKNYAYFRVNYLAVIAAILAVSLLTNPLSLLMLVGLMSSWIFLYLFRSSDHPIVLFGRTFSDRETLAILTLLSVFVIFLTSVGSLLISALFVGVGLVCAHGAFRVPEDLFLDEQEPAASTGFLSFLGGTASNVVAAAGPAMMAARV